jgi:hypothetical protein
MKNSIIRKALVPSIAGLICLPWLNSLFNFVPNPNLENRAYAKFPAFKIEQLNHYPSQLDTFINDKFSFRAAAMQIYSRLNLFVFKKSSIPKHVFFGQDGWMFFTGNELATYDGSAYFTQGQTDSIVTKLNYRQQWLQNQGIQYCLVILPVKNSVYGDKLSPSLQALKKKNRTDFLIEALKVRMPNLKLIDIRDDLAKARKIRLGTPLCYKTDNHWNRLGAFHGAIAILRGMQSHGVGVQVPRYSDYSIDSVKTFTGNLASFAGLQGTVTEWEYRLNPLKALNAKQIDGFPTEVPVFANSFEYQMRYLNKDTTLPKVLFIRDSFGSDMLQALAEGCGQSLFIFDQWQYGLNKDWVQKFKPKIMVQLVLEKHLEHLLFSTPYPEG